MDPYKSKPHECSYCRYSYGSHFGSGFCPDYIPSDPKILLVFPYPTEQEVNQSRVIKWGFWEKYVEPFGYAKEDCQVTHLLRCTLSRRFKQGKKRAEKEYPTGTLKKNAENSCRYYDEPTYNFGPTRFLITLDPADVFLVTSYHRQILADMGKAFRWVKEGHRPVVLLGKEPAEFYAPFIVGKGSAKTWRGHFWDINEWPFKGKEKYVEIETPEFKELKVKNNWWRK